MRLAFPPRRNCALTLVEVLVIVAVVLVLAAVLLPALVTPQIKSARANCMNNLKQLGLAFRTWEGDYGNRYPMTVPTAKGGTQEALAGTNMFRHFAVMSNEINNPRLLICPADDRKPARDFATMNNANVSYFVGLDADERFPAMPLAGDRNLITNGIAVGPGLAVMGTNTSLAWSTAMHNRAGNLGLADGSVRDVNNADLQQLFQASGTNVNRLAVP